ncbi:MAG: hypothetical protein QIT40_gp34 [Lokiarchaeia virus VerdaV4]|uniref:Uncharacterized protein n=1 Tax=Lokiarchaeia virus VerdaV4 TaxID=3070172 RepID=A0AA35G7D4_9CAUD|nr:MAG: hypothetical protein QIT40_gp34 [Lokiarchaeia virus VerdaV4]BDI54992.1 MAG: hypothetical protein [Lokiarchaeia virus VerdaV4]
MTAVGEKAIAEAIEKNTKAVSELAISIKALVIHVNLQEERRAEALNPSLESNTRVEETVEVVEEVIQDLKSVVVMAQTSKAILAVKNGHQKWVAFSHMIPREEEFELGTLYDIELQDSSKWVLKKAWEKFKPQKQGG